MADRLYVVAVKGGGTFLYDTIDVGRFALRMAEDGDSRPFTVKPWPRWRRWLARVEDWRDSLAVKGEKNEANASSNFESPEGDR